MSLIGQKNRWRISRIVTLPDYQGIGIGMAVAEAVAELHVRRGASHEHHGQPSGGAGPLPPLAALAGGAGAEDRLGGDRQQFIETIAARRAGPWCRSSTSRRQMSK